MDPDVDLHDPAQATEIRPRPWGVLAAIAIGGVIGSEARYGVGELVPYEPTSVDRLGKNARLSPERRVQRNLKSHGGPDPAE